MAPAKKGAASTVLNGTDGIAIMIKSCEYAFSRRQYIALLSAASLVCIAGCSSLTASSEINELNSDLRAKLATIPASDNSDLVNTARQIEAMSSSMIEAHQTFLDEFNRLSIDQSTSSRQLTEISSSYDADRVSRRSKLLELQQQLQGSIPDEYWPEVAEILYKKSDVLIGETRLET
jgi:hypothetical protein